MVGVLLVAVRAVIEERVEMRFVIVPLVEKRFVEVALVVVLFVTVRPVIDARLEMRLEKNPFVLELVVNVALCAVSEEIVVVASVEVPITFKRPDVVALPRASTKKLRFSVHAIPFQ